MFVRLEVGEAFNGVTMLCKSMESDFLCKNIEGSLSLSRTVM